MADLNAALRTTWHALDPIELLEDTGLSSKPANTQFKAPVEAPVTPAPSLRVVATLAEEAAVVGGTAAAAGTAAAGAEVAAGTVIATEAAAVGGGALAAEGTALTIGGIALGPVTLAALGLTAAAGAGYMTYRWLNDDDNQPAAPRAPATPQGEQKPAPGVIVPMGPLAPGEPLESQAGDDGADVSDETGLFTPATGPRTHGFDADAQQGPAGDRSQPAGDIRPELTPPGVLPVVSDSHDAPAGPDATPSKETKTPVVANPLQSQEGANQTDARFVTLPASPDAANALTPRAQDSDDTDGAGDASSGSGEAATPDDIDAKPKQPEDPEQVYVDAEANREHFARHGADAKTIGGKMAPGKFDEVMTRMNAEAGKRLEAAKADGQQINKIIFEVEFDEPVGSFALASLAEHADKNQVKVVRDPGTPYETVVTAIEVDALPATRTVKGILGPYLPKDAGDAVKEGQQGVGLYTFYPEKKGGETAPPMPNDRQPEEVRQKNKDYWDSHGFLATREQIAAMPRADGQPHSFAEDRSAEWTKPNPRRHTDMDEWRADVEAYKNHLAGLDPDKEMGLSETMETMGMGFGNTWKWIMYEADTKPLPIEKIERNKKSKD